MFERNKGDINKKQSEWESAKGITEPIKALEVRLLSCFFMFKTIIINNNSKYTKCLLTSVKYLTGFLDFVYETCTLSVDFLVLPLLLLHYCTVVNQ